MKTVHVEKAPNGFVITDTTGESSRASFRPQHGAYTDDQAMVRLREYGFPDHVIEAALKEATEKRFSMLTLD
jgi:hypothetical protein